MTNNKKVLQFVADVEAFAQPDKVVWIDGSDAQRDALREEACATGEIIKLNQEKLPGCYYHRTAENDVARVEDRTFICCENEEDALPHSIVKWKAPKEAYAMVNEIAKGAYKGRTMYVIPYSMGVVGSPFSKIGIEITDSIYVVLNMMIMTRVGKMCLDQLGADGDFVKGFHAKCNVDPEKRYIMHFPEDNTIISVNSAYGGNVLLGKKCFALRIATNLVKTATSLKVSTQSATLTPKRDILCTSPKTTPSFPLTPLTVVTYCLVKSASRFVLQPTSVRKRAGWQNTCLSLA